MFPNWKLPKVANIWNTAPALVTGVAGAGLVGQALSQGSNKGSSQQKYGGKVNPLEYYYRSKIR
jgi:hypothetical protein